jgi:hypothetical protein
MKTAVEFFSEGLFNILQEAENNNIFEVSTQNFKRYIEMFSKEAKAMEKEQIIKAYMNVHSENEYRWVEDDLGKELALQYYKETFKSE